MDGRQSAVDPADRYQRGAGLVMQGGVLAVLPLAWLQRRLERWAVLEERPVWWPGAC